RDRPKVLGALGVLHARPRAAVERLARGGHGAVDIGLLRLGHLREQLLGAAVDHVDLRGARGGGPGSVDEEAVGVLERGGGGGLGHGGLLWGAFGTGRGIVLLTGLSGSSRR